MPRKPNTDNSRYNDPFPTRLRALMDERGTKQEDLIGVLGVKKRQSVTGYRDGSTLPTIDKLVSLAEFFDVPTDYLLGLIDVPSRDNGILATCDYTGLTVESANSLHDIRKLSPLIEAYNFMISDRKFLDRVATYCALFAVQKLPHSRFRDIPLRYTAAIMESEDYHFAKAVQLLQTLHDSFKDKFSSNDVFVDETIKRFVANQIDMDEVRKTTEYDDYMDYTSSNSDDYPDIDPDDCYHDEDDERRLLKSIDEWEERQEELRMALFDVLQFKQQKETE